MARCSMVVCATVCAVLTLAGSASAQTSAADQYLRDGTAAPPTTASSGVAAATDAGSGTGTDGSSLSVGAGANGSGGATTGGTGATAAATSAISLTFGASTPPHLADEITAAVLQAGLTPGPAGEITRKAVEDFLGSGLANALAAGGGPGAVGRAVAAVLLHPGAQTAAVLQALLTDPAAITAAPTHAIFTRTTAATGDYGRFLDGVVKGLADVPRVYVELSDATTSFVGAFAKLGVPTVDNLDKPSGKSAFGAILISGAEGNFGGKPTADSKLTALGVQPIAAEVPPAGSPSVGEAMPYLLLVTLVLGALLWALPAIRRGPFRSRSD